MARKRDIGKRYARSLFQLCTGPDKDSFGTPGEVLDELKSFQAALDADSELSNYFFNPVIARAEKFDVVDELKTKLKSTSKFLKVLVENARLESLPDIIQEFEIYKEEFEGVLRVKLEVAHTPSEDLLDRIKALLENLWKRRPEFKIEVNPELLGGFIATASGRTFDASIRSQLDRMKESLTA